MKRVLRVLGPYVWLLLLAVCLSWPALRFDGLVGHPRCTAGCHAWVVEAARELVLSGGGLHSEQLFYPHGADLFRLYG